MTDGEVINVKHPTNNIKDLSYISIYNTTNKKTVLYLHPSYIDVRIGQRVEVGGYLGKQGNTGNSTNPHVHLEVRKGRSKPPSCGIAAAKRTDRPNEDPIPFLYEEVRNFVHPGVVDPVPVVFKKPDLVVEVEVELESITLEPGETFKLYSNLKNQGTAESEETILRYYQSTDDRITLSDKQLGGFARNPLAPNKTIRKYFTVTAPTTPGTYYYGACVDAVDDESDTANNCSEAVAVIVHSGEEIRLTLPDDFISEVAFGPNSTYFVLNAQYPILMKDNNPVKAVYGKSTITLDFAHTQENTLSITLEDFEQTLKYINNANWILDPQELADELYNIRVFSHRITIPDQPPYFMFPLLTTAESLEDLRNNTNVVYLESIVGSLVGLIPLFGDLASLTFSFTLAEWERLKGIDEIFRSVLDPKIVLKPSISDQIIDFFKGPVPPPEDKLRYLFYIPDQRVSNIRVKVEQKYKEGILSSPKIAHYDHRLNLENNTWAAPSLPTMSLVDYSPFRQLSPEVQEYLLRRFGEFMSAWGWESWRIPEETSLFPNYPNPFNPETWIPYQLATADDVSINIYAADGKLVRSLDLGHQPIGIYQSKSRAAYWDGKNASGEPVASGVYFYTLKAGNFSATRKMLIMK